MNINLLLFYVLAFTAVGSAILIVSMKNLVRSLFLFFVTLFAVAGLYVFALADFVAVTQVIVYVGGVLVLMLFAFMLSNKVLLNDLQSGFKGVFSLPSWQAGMVSLALFTVLLTVVWQVATNQPQWITDAKEKQLLIQHHDNTIHHLGINLMTRFILPFEVVSIFLMMALMGAAHLARKEKRLQ
ncbi:MULTISPECIES: NADH-quinone oxidoreductase subunit J family protein [Olivibacter]|uniref:NADH-quinone oxidoreductase subunit J n=1 Tax=Olivibacter jilunii TaxID=985016 RepID=A0ABW6B4K9_9SPHI|nr:NADH-quinone oxidoreductase subunit J [Pseudosphingobacterium sp.]